MTKADTELKDLPNLEFVGRGSPTSGWDRSPRLVYRCESCGSIMRADRNDYFVCVCGAMSLDVDAGRFGSKLGDHAILTYRVISPSDARR
jgi:hypothetical protein